MPQKRVKTATRNGLPLLPDPARDSDAIKLGTLAFPVKATKGYTINSLKAKLKKHGVTVTNARPAAASSSGTPAYFDINNLFDVDKMYGSSFQMPRYLSIAGDSIDAAMGDSTQQALRSIQVLSPNRRLTTLIVRLPGSVTAATAANSILVQANKLLAPAAAAAAASGPSSSSASRQQPPFIGEAVVRQALQELLLQKRGWLRSGQRQDLQLDTRRTLDRKVERARAARHAAKVAAKREPNSLELKLALLEASMALRAAKEAAQVPDSQLQLQCRHIRSSCTQVQQLSAPARCQMWSRTPTAALQQSTFNF
ncbi:hypothetical protein OEZ85_007679 [Tetradesmus obliquus]|uniref:Uncharacterized protein n=1 Tax=Tetradesmus obliquus TaxID=3088 RepID=A0ABY8TGP2_TETOB|nr:hypothetical protein OEZ85_007679 [Tetradesmus obliquus]